MPTSQTIDLIIVGGGLAGSCLALESQNRGLNILLVDDLGKNHSSLVASGLFNPITGRKFNTTWEANKIFKKLHEFYPKYQLENEFFFPRALTRLFPTAKAANDWDSGIGNPFFDDFPEDLPAYINQGFGGISVKKAGWVNTGVFLSEARKIIGTDSVIESQFEVDEIELGPGEVRWKEYVAKKLVFCQGPIGSKNPYFDWLPFSLTKGELLEIETKEELSSMIFTRGAFFLPMTKNTALVGATYDREDHTLEQTSKAKVDLEKKLQGFFNGRYEVINHRVGIRPTVRDRRPLVGWHPAHEQIGILNGLGSKGVSLGPFIAQIFAQNISEGNDIPPEVNISRFFTFFEG